MGLKIRDTIHRIKNRPYDPNNGVCGRYRFPWGEHPERGVYKTTDGGETWEKVLFCK